MTARRTHVGSRRSLKHRALKLSNAIESLEQRTLFAVVPAGFTESLVGASITNPTALAFAPDGRLFVAQQTGQLRVVDHGVLQATPFTTVTTTSSGERGLLGVAFDPDYFNNHFVYVYYTATSPATHNRVSRFTADPNNQNVAAAGSETVLLDLNNLSGATNHNGGAIHFGNDGKLYIGVGENASRANAQVFTNLLGKMLRMNKDGSTPTDNPYFNDNAVTGQNKLIWTLGLRNPFTFAVQRTTGRIFIDDVGEVTWEEINDGIAHSNYGWGSGSPTIEGFIGAQPPPADYRDPKFVYDHTGGNQAIIGGAFYNPVYNSFPASYAGKYFFADLNGGWMRTLDVSGATPVLANFATSMGTPSGIDLGPDGSIYYIKRSATQGAYRIKADDTTAPIASAPAFVLNEAKPTFGTSQRVRVTFNEYVNDSLTASDVVVTNLTTGAVIPTANISIQYDTLNNTATFNFPGYADASGVLPNGNYRITMAAAGVTDISGNALAAPLTFDFYALAGDVNRDRIVDNADQAILTANLGGSNKTYLQGDLNYDGTVNSADQAIYDLNRRYQLVAPGGTVALPATSGDDVYSFKLEAPNVVDVYTNNTAIGAPFRRIYTGITGAAGSITFDADGGIDSVKFVGSAPAESFAFSPSGTIFGGASIVYSSVESVSLETGTGGFDNVTITPGAVVNLIGPTIAALSISGTAIATPASDPLQVTTLSITGSGKLDLGAADLIVLETPMSTIEGYVKSAYNFGGWDGTSGIFSAAAASGPGNTTLGVMNGQQFADNNGGTFDGYAPDSNDVLVKYTYFGDVDFNGSIDASDYNLIDFGFVNHLTGWANGDADYSGGIDASDYNVIDFAYATQSGTL